jgi:hypothetical protein
MKSIKLYNRLKSSKLAWFIGIYFVSILGYGFVTTLIHYTVELIK